MTTDEIIRKKRDGLELTYSEIDDLVTGFVHGRMPACQMAAFLMAVFFRGMSDGECTDLTRIMAASGDIADLSAIQGFKVDKHSTGGVGDTTSLVLAPLVAACGGIVAKMTGRELGHTGGTVDKLEAIPGLQVELPIDAFIANVKCVGVSMVAQTMQLAPADKHIYALRNMTATVDAIPLIAASIMSKKLAAGADGIVLDVKTGSGAFMRSYDEALTLAGTMVRIGEKAGKKTIALVTGMEQPLGMAVGNAVEVQEAIDTLKGGGPADLVALVLALGTEMLLLSDLAQSRADARRRIEAGIASGKGLQKLREFIAAQGGDPEVIMDPNRLPRPKTKIPVRSKANGVIEQLNALDVGRASKILGAGRRTKEDTLDHSIGIVLKKKIGDVVKQGELLALLYSDGAEEKIRPASAMLENAFKIGDCQVKRPKLIHARVTAEGVETL